MGNFNTPALLFGLILLVASIGLFLFGRLKPELQKDSDNVYAIIGIVCSLILFSSAFSLGLGMSFQQLLMIGALIALMLENIKARQPKDLSMSRRGPLDEMRGMGRRGADPGRRGASMLDDERAASNIYRYEADRDDYDRFDDPRRRDQRRIRGSEPRRGYDDEFGGDARRSRPPSRGPQPSLKEADSRRGGYNDFDDRPSRGGARNDDWDDAPRRDPRGGRPPQDFGGRPPQADIPPPRRRPRGGSMDGSPIPPSVQEPPPARRPGNDGPSNGPSNGPRNGPPMDRPPVSRPPMGRPTDRPPTDRPPTDRPPTNRPPADRPPIERPPIDRQPMNRPPIDAPAGNRPPNGRPSMDRPPIDRPPIDRPPLERPPINAGPAPQRPIGGGSKDDDYVDFKPLTPPPDDEMDNSSQFDD